MVKKGFCHRASWSESDLQDPCRKKELILQVVLWASLVLHDMHVHTHTWAYTHVHTYTTCIHTLSFTGALWQACTHMGIYSCTYIWHACTHAELHRCPMTCMSIQSCTHTRHACTHTELHGCSMTCMYTHMHANRHVCTPYSFKFLSINLFSHLAPGVHTQPPFLTRPCFWEVSHHLRTAWGREPELRSVLQDRGGSRKLRASCWGGSFLSVNPDSASCCLSWNSFRQ